MDKQLCGKCIEREKSIQNVKEYLKRKPVGGMILDPTPKAECKRHALYGEKDYQKQFCHDFIAK